MKDLSLRCEFKAFFIHTHVFLNSITYSADGISVFPKVVLLSTLMVILILFISS